eukprot:9212448-Pyramimonas_sp.AAC.1
MAWPPRDGEVPLRSAQCLTPLDPRAVFESDEPTSSPRKWRQTRRSQPPKDGEASLRSARCLTPLDPPAALEHDD